MRITEIGHGNVSQTPTDVRLIVPPVASTGYHDAQITDYDPAQRDFRWAAGVRLSVTARFSAPNFQGTAGFGFWNHPFSPDTRGFRLPQAAWFFYGSPPNHMPLALDVPGYGWKAATLNARRPQFLALLPLALPGFLLMRIPAVYRRLWRVGQNALAVREAVLPPSMMVEPTTYEIDWQHDGVIFRVNGQVVLISPFCLTAPMGFIAWVDNQYAIVTPQGQFGWGLVDVPLSQTLVLRGLHLSQPKTGEER